VAPRLPSFEVRLEKPDIGPWREGNVGVPGFMSFRGRDLGPHVMIVALIHGNEIAGGIVLDRLLREGLRPLRGRLTLGFVNLAAFDRFDPAQPTASRFVDEDLNRIWDLPVLDGPRVSTELMRGRQIRGLVDQADVLFDLHSMLWPADPLILCGSTERGRAMGCEIGTPALVIADHGHAGGARLIDYRPFTSPNSMRTACLVEAGQHWERDTVAVTEAAVLSLLRRHGMIAGEADARQDASSATAEVTDAVTAQTGAFAFVRPFRGGDVIEAAGTLIALDGETEIRTPYDRCLLVMPNLRPTRGHTAVRLARFT
jgi:predicted deacylase